MKKLWLIFAQTVTISLGIMFVLQLFRPDLLGNGAKLITVHQAGPALQQRGVSSYSQAAHKAMPAVVNIFTSKAISDSSNSFTDDPLFRQFFGALPEDQPQRENSLGSGVIVSPEGLILTNHHVIDAADDIEVALADGRTVPARVVGSDPETDLAVVKVEMKKLPSITFGRSETLSVGDVVLAIGNPFGVGQTVTQGIVSALGRNHLGINTFENFIQTDAPINPGNSGGALIDTNGNMIGLNSAIYSRSGGSMGIGFAIPVSLARQVMEQIIRDGGVTRGWIGIEAQDITPELAESFRLREARGALIAGVMRGGPADQAGVKPGDILLDINGRPVIDSAGMLNLIAALKPGQPANIRVVRNQAERSYSVLIGKRPKLQQPGGD
ncbi:putative periplasmic serine endoprotease DegP-like precursor [mine drainage metagenome]|uniref:Putative periplasmic serine endoprotease DegP-like n=1 Tax=mine drainage metagenome TaxID=410659 RepID=A0A1J5QSI7_9ZZZZ